jgi:hypothetical protein
MAALVLINGQAAEFADEHTGLIRLGLAVDYGYLGLMVLTRRTLRANRYFVEDGARVVMAEQGKPAFSIEGGS